MADFGPPPKFTEQDLLDLLANTFEDHWIEGLLADPSSQSVFTAIAQMMLRVQDAVDNSTEGLYILTAAGGARASSSVRISRASGGGAAIIPATTRFQDSRGAIWNPSADFSYPPSGTAQDVDVPLVSDRRGYFVNSTEQITFVALDALPDPAMTITAVTTTTAVGGASPQLDELGNERGFPRSSGEDSQEYRLRLTNLPDAVSPKAITETLVAILDKYDDSRFIASLITQSGLSPIREPFRDPTHYNLEGLHGTDVAFFDDVTYFDDTHGHQLRSLEDACAFWDILLPTITISPGSTDDPIREIVAELDRKRAFCVRFRIIVGEEIPLARTPNNQSPSGQVGDWSTNAGSTVFADIASSLEKFDADTTYATNQTGRGGGAVPAAGDLRVDFTAPFTPPVSISHVVLRASVARADAGASNGSLAFNFTDALGNGATILPGIPVGSDLFEQRFVILEENPALAAPWTVAHINGTIGVGLANVAAAGPTNEIRASQLVVEIFANYG